MGDASKRGLTLKLPNTQMFKFEELSAAYEYLQKGRHIGKVVVSV